MTQAPERFDVGGRTHRCGDSGEQNAGRGRLARDVACDIPCNVQERGETHVRVSRATARLSDPLGETPAKIDREVIR